MESRLHACPMQLSPAYFAALMAHLLRKQATALRQSIHSLTKHPWIHQYTCTSIPFAIPTKTPASQPVYNRQQPLRPMVPAKSTPQADPVETSSISPSLDNTVESQINQGLDSCDSDRNNAPKDWQGGTCGRLPGQKRTVALHVVYVGSKFRGLQLSRDFPVETTVEGVLELALLKAGLILPSNYGDLFKIKWTRSSRTDKGVHSLGTVISVRIVLENADETFEKDYEGLGVAARINEHLPSSVRVLSVQRVPKKFNARRFCAERTYEYYLPVSVLGMAYDGSEADAEKLRCFRAALALFEGRHPFHNYTVRRGQYLETPGSIARRQAAAAASVIADSTAAAAAAAASSSTAQSVESCATLPLPSQQQQQQQAAQCSGSPRQGKAGRKGKGGNVDEEGEGEEQEEEEEEAYQAALAASAVQSGEAGAVVKRCWRQLCSWVHDDAMSEKDRVGVRHYRQITQFSAGGTPCIRITVTGGSFMLNQIRHMIGAAVAVTGGYLSMDLVPKAPPYTLLLSSCTFPPFRGAGTEEPLVARYSDLADTKVAQWVVMLVMSSLRHKGKALTLRQGGAAARSAFVHDVLAPELNELLNHPNWQHFTTTLDWFVWDSTAATEVVELSQQWKAAGLAKYQQKKAAEEAAALQEESIGCAAEADALKAAA